MYEFSILAAAEKPFRPEMNDTVFWVMTVAGLLFCLIGLIGNACLYRLLAKHWFSLEKKSFRLLHGVLLFFVTVPFFASIYAMARYGFVRVFFSTANETWWPSTVFWWYTLCGLVGILSMTGSLLARFTARVIQAGKKRKGDEADMQAFQSRRAFLGKGTAAGLAVVSGGAIAAGHAYTHYPKATFTDVKLENLPEQFDGFRIAFMGDFHYESGDGPIVRRGCRLARDFRPDLVVLGGDYTGTVPADITQMSRILKKELSGLTVIGVLGNHDYYSARRSNLFWEAGPFVNEDEVADIFRHGGVRMLRNQSFELQKRGQKICFAGLEDYWSRKMDAEKGFENSSPDAYRVIIEHNPDPFPFLMEEIPFSFYLAAHTHGGQVRLPGLGTKVPNNPKWLHGLYALNGRKMFVTRGIGTINPRIRINCPPEMAGLILCKA